MALINDAVGNMAGRARRRTMAKRFNKVPSYNPGGAGLHSRGNTGISSGIRNQRDRVMNRVRGAAPAPVTAAVAAPAPTPVVIGGVTYSDSASPVAQQAAAQAAQNAPAAPAAPAAAAPGTSNRYPWLDSAYGKYYDKIQQDFADRGLLDSTNKIQPMTELADAYAQRYAQEARTDNQTAVQNAMSLWELLTSANLAKSQTELGAGLDYNYTGVAQPSIFSNILNQQYLPPLPGSGPVGDAPVVSRPVGVRQDKGEVVPTYTETAPNVAYRDNQANIAANRAIQNAYLKMAQDEAGKADSDTAKWEQMAADVVQNKLAGKAAPGSNLFPNDIFESFQAAYGIDIVGLVRAGDPRAIALVRSAYDDPKVADAVIARMQGVPGSARREGGGSFGGPTYPSNNLGSLMRSGDEAVAGALNDYGNMNPMVQRLLTGAASRAFPGRVPSAINLASNLFSGYNWLNSPSK